MTRPGPFRHAALPLAFAASLFGMSLSAEAMEITAEQRAACTPDALRLCSAEIPNIPRVTACMRANRTNLSARCQSAMAAADHPAVATAPKPRTHVAAHAEHSTHQDKRLADPKDARHPKVVAIGHREPYRQRHDNYFFGSRRQTEEAMAIAAQIMAGFNQACTNRSLPYDVCHDR